jgi:MoxR-like ATPase
MNPPSTDEDENGYSGSEPLDAALADRFAFIVSMPDWTRFNAAEQLSVIRAEDTPIAPDDAKYLTGLIERTAKTLSTMGEAFSQGVALYVQTVVALLGQAGFRLSPRRANLLYRNVLAVNAAALAVNPDIRASDATLLALRHSLPQLAQGIAVPDVKLLSAHREAIRTIQLDVNDPLRIILCASSPLERIQLAIKARKLKKTDFSSVIADALAQMANGAREAAIVHLFESGAVGRLNAAVAAQIGEAYQSLIIAPNFSETLHATHSRYQTWTRLKGLLAQLNPADPRAHLQANAVAALFARKTLQTTQDAEQAFHAFATTDQQLRSA